MGMLDSLEILSAEQREAILRHMQPVRFSSGDCIFRVGARGDGCYFIETGDVRLELDGNEHVDTERTLGYLSEGSLLGELAVLDGLPRSASAYAQTFGRNSTTDNVSYQHLQNRKRMAEILES